MPPVIQSVVKKNNEYAIGYTVDKNDKSVQVEYTTINGVKMVESELKGSFKIYENAGIISFRIRKKTDSGTSAWSKTELF